MNVVGLNNLGLSQAAPKAEGKVAPSKGEHSFERALNQAQAKPPTKVAINSSRSQEEKAEKAVDDKASENSQNGEDRQRETPTQTPVQAQAIPDKAKNNSELKVAPRTETKDSVATRSSAQEMTEIESPLTVDQQVALLDPDATDAQVDIVKESIAAFMAPQKAASPFAVLNRAEMKISAEALPADPERATAAIWTHFLNKMNELGITPEKVLHAFATLDKKEMAGSPEQNVDKLVMAMGLTGAQAAIAKKEFLSLVRKTQEIDSASVPLSRELAAAAALKLTLPPSKAAPALKAPPTSPPQVVQETPRAEDEDSKPAAKAAPVSSSPSEAPPAGETAKAATPVAAAPFFVKPTPVAAPSSPELKSLVDRMKPVDDDAPADKEVEALVRSVNSAPAKTLASPSALQNLVAASSETQAPALAKVSAPTVMPAAASTLAATGILAKGEEDKNQDTSGEDRPGNDAAAVNAAMANEAQGAHHAKGDFQAQLTNAQGPHAAAVPMQEIVQKAQVMVREGGGDMKVTLRPDGLGEISMKISVTNGKVSVQMVAQSDEARKLLERQISDLRTGLTANHLQVESIKVDSAAGASKHFDQQFQDSQQRQQQSQANLEQFRQDASGGRRGTHENRQAHNPYRGGGDAKAETRGFNIPRPPPSLGSRRLDLVA